MALELRGAHFEKRCSKLNNLSRVICRFVQLQNLNCFLCDQLKYPKNHTNYVKFCVLLYVIIQSPQKYLCYPNVNNLRGND